MNKENIELTNYPEFIASMKTVIQKHSLQEQNRKRDQNYKRIVIAQELKRNHMTLSEIARLLKRNHATVINMLKNYAILSNYSDFREVEERLLLEVQGNKTIVDRVLECENYFEMVKLQKELQQIPNVCK